MNKTIIVCAKKLVNNYRYGKRVLKTKKYITHDENNISKVGDIVKIIETRPLSKTKRWKLVKLHKKVQ